MLNVNSNSTQIVRLAHSGHETGLSRPCINTCFMISCLVSWPRVRLDNGRPGSEPCFTVGGLPGKVGGLPGKVGGLPGKVGGLPGKVGGLPGKVGGLPGKVGVCQVRLGVCQVRLRVCQVKLGFAR